LIIAIRDVERHARVARRRLPEHVIALAGELRHRDVGVIGPDHRQRPRWWRQLVQALERVLQHRARAK